MSAPQLSALLNRNDFQLTADQITAEILQELTATWISLFERITEQQAFWADNRDVKPLQVAVIHDQAYQALIALNLESNTPRSLREHFDQLWAEAAATASKCTPTAYRHDPTPYILFDCFYNRLLAIGTEMRSSFPGERTSLEPAITSFVNKEISMNDLFLKVLPWLQMRLACKGLAALNLHYDPMVYAGQDYTNQLGNAYARFVGQVASSVTRHRLEQLFGNFRPYRLIAKSTLALDLLVREMPAYDGRVLPLGSTPLSDGRVEVLFECGHAPDVLREIVQELADIYPNLQIYSSSLQQR